MGNMDIISNALNNYSKVINVNKEGIATLKPQYKEVMNNMPNRQDKEAFFKNFDSSDKVNIEIAASIYRPYITSNQVKPFLLLAGISALERVELYVNWPGLVGIRVLKNTKRKTLVTLRWYR